MAHLRCIILVDNMAGGRGLLAEHGLAMWIEVGSSRVLFDTGQTDVLCHNADHLGIDLVQVDAIILSHGHYDHTGGLEAVLRKGDRMNVFVPPRALADKYARNPDGTGRYIGVPVGTREANGQHAVVIPTAAPREVGDGLFVTGPVPRVTDFEDTGGAFFRDVWCTQPDDLVDDQAAFIDTPEGVFVIFGCAHAGVVNTLRYIQTLLPGRPIHTVIGGMHLGSADNARMTQTIAVFRELDVQRLVPIHCTGFDAAARLWHGLPGRVTVCPVGGGGGGMSAQEHQLTHLRDQEHPTCVVCGNRNSRGLGAAFVVRPDGGVESSFYCDHDLAGYTGILHGGIISSLLDGAMTHCLFARGKVALTAELRVRMRRPVPTGSVVSVRAWLVRSVAVLHVAKAELSQNGRLAAMATAKFMEKCT